MWIGIGVGEEAQGQRNQQTWQLMVEVLPRGQGAGADSNYNEIPYAGVKGDEEEKSASGVCF